MTRGKLIGIGAGVVIVLLVLISLFVWPGWARGQSAPPPYLSPTPEVRVVEVTKVVVVEQTASAPAAPANTAAVIYDQLFKWSNGAAHVGLPIGPNGANVSWLVHGDIFGESQAPGCYWVVLNTTNEIVMLYPGTYRIVGIQGGTLEDRLAVANDRIANLGVPCTKR